MRVRAKAFADLLRQEVAYFDRPENSSGSICARLSLDALAVQTMCGIRLGIIVEAIAMFSLGLLFGCLFSLKLTLVALLFTVIIFIIIAMNVVVESRRKKRTSHLLERASSVNIV